MSKIITYQEQYDKLLKENIDLEYCPFKISFPKKRENGTCVFINKNKKEGGFNLKLSYFVGVDWISINDTAIYVEPKLNFNDNQTNYLQMLFSALKHPEVSAYTNELFNIKFDKPLIEIEQKHDLLTPLLVIQFLNVVKEIVRKGLKKSYYSVEQNLHSRVKGKILISQTIKKNHLQNKSLYTYCSFDEFGLNNLENRLLKKTLMFIRRYLPSLKNIHSEKFAANIFNYIMPAFEIVSEEVSLKDIKYSKINVFFKEYEEAIRLAKMILKRFGYNITNTQQTTLKTPPFWIDMSKLFELYVLGLLKDRFKTGVKYQFKSNNQELDYLLNTSEYKMVIDSKYKTLYGKENDYKKEDIRQISGYARFESVYDKLGINKNENIDCLIIYPDQNNGNENLLDVQFDSEEYKIKQFVNFYKIGVELPVI